MNEREFRERLALEPLVPLVPLTRAVESLPRELRDAALSDASLRSIVEERAQLDALLGQADEIEPPAGFAEAVTREAYRGDRVGPTHIVPLRTKVAAAAAIAGILTLGIFLTRGDVRDESGQNVAEAPTDPEMLVRLELFLDDWDDVLENEDDLDLAAGLEVAEVFDDLSLNEADEEDEDN